MQPKKGNNLHILISIYYKNQYDFSLKDGVKIKRFTHDNIFIRFMFIKVRFHRLILFIKNLLEFP